MTESVPRYLVFYESFFLNRAGFVHHFFRTVRIIPFVLFWLTVSAFCCCPQSFGAFISSNYSVGMRTFGVWEPDSRERFDFSVWYPSKSQQMERTLEGWIVNSGRRGRILPGFYPVLLLSHDTASGRYANNDLAASLASSGFLVIVPSHPGDNQSDSGALYTAELVRDRPRHLLRALESVLASPDFALYADESRIGLIGVGFGSITVLQLAGAVPDFSLLQSYCSQNAVADAFCAPWTAERLARLAEDMLEMQKRDGLAVFTPARDMYAPELMAAPIPVTTSPAPPEEKKPSRDAKGDFSLKRLLFGKNDEDKAPLEQEEPESPTPPPAPVQATASAAPATSALDFQGGPLFGGTDSGEPFVHIALPNSPQYRVTVTEGTNAAESSPDAFADKDVASLVHRRPPSTRRILGIALLAPAGGMLFSRESLAGIQVPVALVEAGQDSLYPPRMHSHPYYTRLPALPVLLPLATADHYSLFARCSKDTMMSLGGACGRLVGEQRKKLVEQRDRFLESFFHSILGEPLPPALPSGFVAVPSAQ